MPIKKCTTASGAKGYQYGSQKCYGGSSGRSKAIKQMQAIKISEAKRKKK